MSGVCLFSAPYGFLGGVLDEYRGLMPTICREVWRREELEGNPGVTAWVMNPGQMFVIDEGVLDLYPNLEVLVTPSTGSDHIDQGACSRRGIAVYSLLDDRENLNQITASAEFTFLLLLYVMRRPDIGIREVSARRWRTREDMLRGHELSGKQVGLVGFGRIGQRVARYCEAFDARIAYHDPYVKDGIFPAWSLEEMFALSDAICICCSLTSETRGMIDRKLLVRLKPGAALVNTARGEVIVEADLINILGARSDLRVSLDVVTGEVMGSQTSSRLLELQERGQVVITPHMAGATVESQQKAAGIALGLLRRHIEACRSSVRG